jgi:glucokinase
MEKVALGIDIGGTNTAYGLVSVNGEILVEKNIPTATYTNPEDLCDAIFNSLKEELVNYNFIGVGIGAPNGNQNTGTIDFAPNLSWKGIVPIASIFESKFKVKTVLTNDANAAAIGEKIFGVAKDLTDFVEITLGTGLGSGVIANNELVVGKNGLAGEYGHIRVVTNGRLCGCGRNGCLETYVSSTGVVRSISELQSDNKKISKLMWIESPTAKDVFKLAIEGDLFAEEIVDFTAEMLGSALADFAAFSNPEAYVLFGGLSLSGVYFSGKVQNYLEENLLNIYKNKIVVKNSSLNGKNAAILGASAAIFWNTLDFDFDKK